MARLVHTTALIHFIPQRAAPLPGRHCNEASRIDVFWHLRSAGEQLDEAVQSGPEEHMRIDLYDNGSMYQGLNATLLCVVLLLRGCSWSSEPVKLKYPAIGKAPVVIALYEAWFGQKSHLSVGYSTQDPEVIKRQILSAKKLGISAFVVDWYGDRDPFIDKSYALMQRMAEKNKFGVAMMYDETNPEEGATDLVLADFTMFHETYLSAGAPGRSAYLTYGGRPIIFVFPHGGHTDWAKVREVVDRWDHPPILIQENLPGPHPDAFDGFYPWVNPGPQGWAADGSHWGEDYLSDFYKNMADRYPDKMTVGGAWPQFDDSKASWGLNRHISARCGQTYTDTFNLWRKFFPADQTIPFLMVETWNDYEEGSAIEPGLPICPAR